MSKILITGADGFTGRYLVDALLDRGHEIHAVVRDGILFAAKAGLVFHRCELDDAKGLIALLKQVVPQKVVHLAAIAFVAHDDVDEIYRVNLLGTRHLLQAVEASGGVDAVLLASSANIYGNGHSGRIDEDASPNPANDYGVSKLAMEYLAKLYADRLPIIVSRPFNYTGVGQSTRFLIPKIVDHIRRRASVIELGNLDVDRDWLDVRTVVDAYVRLLENAQSIGRTLNISSGRAQSLRGLVALACSIADHAMEIRVNPAFVRKDEVRSLCGDKSALEAVIGPLVSRSMADTIRWMLE